MATFDIVNVTDPVIWPQSYGFLSDTPVTLCQYPIYNSSFWTQVPLDVVYSSLLWIMYLSQFACCLNLCVSPVSLAEVYSLSLVLGSGLSQINHMLPLLYLSVLASVHCCPSWNFPCSQKNNLPNLSFLQIMFVFAFFSNNNQGPFLCFNSQSSFKFEVCIRLFLAFPSSYNYKILTKCIYSCYSCSQKLEGLMNFIHVFLKIL